ncbi:MAG: hypothetical protein CME66_13520 [Halobacteriovoraceae bacterium]|jgi:hypothetical protein|nr:hypothetical protein [Halobacteriovoraceae bacterium]|tara:strand:- start:422 stop:721 length:300 start_codon:yes stop_codon:yes gene_type:complete
MSTPAKKLTLEIDTNELSEHHLRLIKSINSLMTHVLTTQSEEDYFEGSSDLLRLVANAIKKAKFSENNQQIEYAQQALEFCVDNLSDQVYQNEVTILDN